ncbi:hypothetical protein TEQG_00657 [Trichophyton equinum CBS 127.97]|uniref:Uncharacterized protein n=1 Tax=Trichophyton equinum (strain ATCC MYA-4606 / CBS 127.97) TaxID=559882 RepID=F2PI49_TRIEC|nr:hypothetical protein TEQG_00657 [Trichophyton equinum CBS 127.97]
MLSADPYLTFDFYAYYQPTNLLYLPDGWPLGRASVRIGRTLLHSSVRASCMGAEKWGWYPAACTFPPAPSSYFSVKSKGGWMHLTRNIFAALDVCSHPADDQRRGGHHHRHHPPTSEFAASENGVLTPAVNQSAREATMISGVAPHAINASDILARAPS